LSSIQQRDKSADRDSLSKDRFMPDAAVLASFVLASILIVVVPGPTVTVIIANSLRHGAAAGMLNVLGTQIGLASMIAVLATGLSAVVSLMGSLFEVLRLVGAAYLIWLGIKLWRANGTLATREPGPRPFGSFVVQGFAVIWSNPKALLFFGAFIPQFLEPAGDPVWQTVLFGGLFMVVATVFDGVYALAAGGAGRWLSTARIRLTERVAGTFLIGGGVWLALAKR
jgi:threonine/homoserine/homoserine lactone efflux protein